mmetsp:Transcript_8393/g.16711  ORF Transcript_8393/g.16711 Transcript_8393/m.16711 type:complete len:183 (-) Transcript_8393:1-549(-)
MLNELNHLVKPWTFWHSLTPRGADSRNRAQAYEEGLVRLNTFTTVEDFFSTYLFLLRPSELVRGNTLYCFIEDKKPLWETFPNGACWIVKVPREAALTADSHWEKLLLTLVGGTWQGEVVGVGVSAKTAELILQVWMGELAVKEAVAERLKSLLGVKVFYFKANEQSLMDLSTLKHAALVTV